MSELLSTLEEITNGKAYRDWRNNKVQVVHVVSPMFDTWHNKHERELFVQNSFYSITSQELPCVVIPHSALEQEYDTRVQSTLKILSSKRN